MHGVCQLFSHTLLVEMEERLLIRWVILYALTSVRRRGEKEKHTRALTRLISPGVAWAHDVRMNSPPKFRPKPHMHAASFPCLRYFDRDRPSHLRDVVIIDESSLYIRAATTKIATYQQPRKHQHI
jgi:hypothetical protein